MKITPKSPEFESPDLLFCCSGAADTAEIADRAVRSLHKGQVARMFCLAGIAGEVETIVENSRGAVGMVLVDGCDSDCAKRTMERAGFGDFLHVRVTDLGMEKGKTPVSEERIAQVAGHLRGLVHRAVQH